MKKDLVLTTSLVALVAILASFEFQGAEVSESGANLSVSGYESYPQIGLIVALQLVSSFGSRYWLGATSRIANLLVAALSLLAVSPIASGLLDGRGLQLLQAKIEKATGISDWVSQLDVVIKMNTNYPAIWALVAAICFLITANLLRAFFGPKARLREASQWLN